MRKLIYAVDIGSSRVHAGIVDTGRRACIGRHDFPVAEMSRRLPALIDNARYVVPAVIAGGSAGHAQKAGTILRRKKIFPVIPLQWHSRLPIRFRYKKPSSLGADRIADALYAARIFPGRNVIIIDSGTAITVDAVNGRAEFLGGAIIAGIGTQLGGLHAAAGTLPAVRLQEGTIAPLGCSTIDCLRAGAAYGTAGALNLVVKKYRRFLGRNCIVCATGGAWHFTKKLVDFDFIEVPDMTLIGMALYAAFRKRSGLQ